MESWVKRMNRKRKPSHSVRHAAQCKIVLESLVHPFSVYSVAAVLQQTNDPNIVCIACVP